MMLSLWLGLLVGLLWNAAPAAAVVFRDPDTGLSFASQFVLYKSDGRGITYRVAIAEGVDQYSAYDVVLQMVAPNDVGWAGLAWGGSMARNPLLVAWRNPANNQPVISSRWANGHTTPANYAGSVYTVLKTGTKSNNTHWQVTAKCTGCSSWTTNEGGLRYLSPRGGNRMAWAYSPDRPTTPASSTSAIRVHDVHNYFSQDFAQAGNRDFTSTLQKLQETQETAQS